jgi:hypothetical protein
VPTIEPEAGRKKILLSANGAGQFIGQHFGVTEDQVRQIEHEGLDRLWPPL